MLFYANAASGRLKRHRKHSGFKRCSGVEGFDASCPVYVDPSIDAPVIGKYVIPLSRAAVAVAPMVLIVEVHRT